MIFSASYADFTGTVYRGDVSATAIANSALAQLQNNFIAVVDEIDDFLEIEPSKYHVLVFSDAVELKAVSWKYSSGLVFGSPQNGLFA